MNRREMMVVVLSLAVSASPLATRAQQAGPTRRIAVLMGYAESDQEAQLRLATFKNALPALGWIEGRNLRIDIRWTAGDIKRAAALARELVKLKPDVVLTNTTPATLAVQRETRTIPIVFTIVSDPVGSGLIESLSRPGGNVTGFINLESSLGGKWVEMLKEIAPHVSRVAVMFNPETTPYVEYYFRPLNIAAQKLGVATVKTIVRSPLDISEALTALGRQPGSGLIAMSDSFLFVHRKLLIDLTARDRIPAVYWVGNIPVEGGLLAYGVDYHDIFRRSATYVDRILRGANPGDLPVEQPRKFELAVNAKTAKALGLTIPTSLLLRADRVIE
jgi:putative ABC transport system substrate-binding protein